MAQGCLAPRSALGAAATSPPRWRPGPDSDYSAPAAAGAGPRWDEGVRLGMRAAAATETGPAVVEVCLRRRGSWSDRRAAEGSSGMAGGQLSVGRGGLQILA